MAAEAMVDETLVAVVAETLVAMQLQATEVDRVIQESADFELAYQMQLTEALSASASVSGASSSSVDSGDHNDGDVIMDEGEQSRRVGDAVAPEDRQVALTDQQDEMEKLNQEMRDEVEAFKEQSRLAEIEAITVHDARFARFLSTVSDGENLTDPFTYTPDQTFVRGKRKAVIGGQKPTKGLEVGSASTSVLCQSDMWEPGVAAAYLLDDDKSYLATIKEGFHLDRKATKDLQNRGLSEGGRSSTCRICMETVMSPENSLVVSDECQHRFCTECLQKHAETAVKSGKSYIACPEYHCEKLWTSSMSKLLLSSNSLLMLTQRQIEDAFPEHERVYCPFQNCSALQLKPELPTQPSTSGHPHETAVGGVECFACSRFFCLECQVPWHGDLTCEEFHNLPRDERSSEDVNLKGLAKQKKWQRCKHCGVVVELLSGCHHITCRCGSDFCYTCGDSWASGHLCRVPL